MSPDRLSWYIAGPLIGLLIVALRAALNRPFGALGGFVDLAEAARGRATTGLRLWLLLGLIAGGALYALGAGTFHLTLAYGTAGGLLPTDLPAQIALVTVAGMMMGYGARAAGGCTSGHGMCGMSLLSPASLVSTATFFTTAVVLANLLAYFLGGAP
jgi:uncharacterized membrane protein YedE/YeeE